MKVLVGALALLGGASAQPVQRLKTAGWKEVEQPGFVAESSGSPTYAQPVFDPVPYSPPALLNEPMPSTDKTLPPATASPQKACFALLRSLFTEGGFSRLLLLEHHSDPRNVEFQIDVMKALTKSALVSDSKNGRKKLPVYLELNPPKDIRQRMETDLASSSLDQRRSAIEVSVSQRETSAVKQDGGKARAARVNKEFVNELSKQEVQVEFAAFLDPERDDVSRWQESGGILVAGFAHGFVHSPRRDMMALVSEGVEVPMLEAYRTPRLTREAQKKAFDIFRTSGPGTVVCMQNEIWKEGSSPKRAQELDHYAKDHLVLEVGLKGTWNATFILKGGDRRVAEEFVRAHADIARIYEPAATPGTDSKTTLTSRKEDL
jgi:hypothetical protein